MTGGEGWQAISQFFTFLFVPFFLLFWKRCFLSLVLSLLWGRDRRVSLSSVECTNAGSGRDNTMTEAFNSPSRHVSAKRTGLRNDSVLIFCRPLFLQWGTLCQGEINWWGSTIWGSVTSCILHSSPYWDTRLWNQKVLHSSEQMGLVETWTAHLNGVCTVLRKWVRNGWRLW